MPEEAAPNTKVVDLNKTNNTPQTFEFKKSKFYIFSVVVLLLFLASLFGSYVMGVSNERTRNEAALEKKTETKNEEPKDDIKEVDLGEEVVVKSGLTLELDEANIDQVYEKQKEDLRKSYEKNASQSAYLQSDYFTTSNLVLKITLTNSTKNAISYNPSGFRLKDSDDNQYVVPTSGERPQVYGLNPAETTKITVSFIVPTEEKDFKLIYENAIISFRIK